MKPDPTLFLGKHAALLSGIEVGLGSVLHGFRMPFSGQFLSLNQIFLLTRALEKSRHIHPVPALVPATISNISAVLKSLSPAGKKLTPMLAISAQGFLYSLGPMLFGVGWTGTIVGSLLSGLWAFVQPLLLYYILFGHTLIQIGEYYYEKTQEAFPFDSSELLLVLSIIVGIKLSFSIVAVILAKKMSEPSTNKYQDHLLSLTKLRRGDLGAVTDQRGSVRRGMIFAFKDLCHPLFFISLLATLFFFLYAEATTSTIIWALLRPIAVGFIGFFMIRVIDFEKMIRGQGGRRFPHFANALQEAIRELKKR